MDLVPNKLQGGGEGEEGWNVEKCQRPLKGSGILVARWVMVYLPMLRKTKAFCGMPRTSRTYMYMYHTGCTQVTCEEMWALETM